MTDPLPRISAVVGQTVALDASFYLNGVAANPYAIRQIDIYVESAIPENLVASIPLPAPTDPSYPSPLVNPSPGEFILEFEIPCDFEANRTYIDVWRFIGTDACVGSDLDDMSLWQEKCLKFFVFPEGFYVDDGLIIPRFGFEPLDFKLRKGEVRTIEVGITPLPLYDFNFNCIYPIIPQLKPFITIETDQCELLVDRASGRMGLRQGTYRTNPFTAQFTLDTNAFIKGTYIYRVSIDLPNGETRISDDMRLTIY